jgi:hypothetical protein
MPKVRRRGIPVQLLEHRLERIRIREIPMDQLALLAEWLDRQSEVPTGKWSKRFPGMIVCGEADLVKTLLLPHQTVLGDEIRQSLAIGEASERCRRFFGGGVC